MRRTLLAPLVLALPVAVLPFLAADKVAAAIQRNVDTRHALSILQDGLQPVNRSIQTGRDGIGHGTRLGLRLLGGRESPRQLVALRGHTGFVVVECRIEMVDRHVETFQCDFQTVHRGDADPAQI